jgi:hypothetical protein
MLTPLKNFKCDIVAWSWIPNPNMSSSEVQQLGLKLERSLEYWLLTSVGCILEINWGIYQPGSGPGYGWKPRRMQNQNPDR